jgi:hypothetical protein
MDYGTTEHVQQNTDINEDLPAGKCGNKHK